MRYTVTCFVTALLFCGCSAPESSAPAKQPSAGVLSDWPESARAAVYTRDVPPGFGSPEALDAYLEQRWPLWKIEAACRPDTLATALKQDLVLDYGEAWKGRLYEDRDTAFDKISWYASVSHGKVMAYSLHANRGKQCWMISGGGPDTDTAAVDKPTPIHWQDAAANSITGELGKPLGTVCKIQGTAQPMTRPDKDDGHGAVLLEIDTVDGVELDRTLAVRSTDVAGLKDVPRAEQPFSLVVYETGYFVGPLADPHRLVPPVKAKPALARQERSWHHYQLRVQMIAVDAETNK